MRNIAKNLRVKSLLRIAALAASTAGLGGCATLYDDYYDNSYYDTAYSDYTCDPYSPFDNYYDCDSRLGFYNFGYSGGWYNNLFYPGYGFYIFDRGGRRYDMDNNHRRYWGGRRHAYWQQYGRSHGQQGGRHTYGGSGRPSHYQPIAWPEQNGGRVNDGEHRRRDRHQGNGQGYRNGGQNGDHNRGGRGYGRRDGRVDGQGAGRSDGQGAGQPAPVTQNSDQQNAQPAPLRHPRNGNVNSGRSEGDYGNRGRGRDFSANAVQQQSAPAPQAQPEPRARPEPRTERRSEPRSEPRTHPRSPGGKLGGYGNDRM